MLKMINTEYHHLVFAFFMALLMSCIMSFVISVFNVGFVEDIFNIWIRAWSFAFLIAFPAVILVSPTVKRLVSLVMKEE